MKPGLRTLALPLVAAATLGLGACGSSDADSGSASGTGETRPSITASETCSGTLMGKNLKRFTDAEVRGTRTNPVAAADVAVRDVECASARRFIVKAFRDVSKFGNGKTFEQGKFTCLSKAPGDGNASTECTSDRGQLIRWQSRVS